MGSYQTADFSQKTSLQFKGYMLRRSSHWFCRVGRDRKNDLHRHKDRACCLSNGDRNYKDWINNWISSSIEILSYNCFCCGSSDWKLNTPDRDSRIWGLYQNTPLDFEKTINLLTFIKGMAWNVLNTLQLWISAGQVPAYGFWIGALRITLWLVLCRRSSQSNKMQIFKKKERYENTFKRENVGPFIFIKTYKILVLKRKRKQRLNMTQTSIHQTRLAYSLLIYQTQKKLFTSEMRAL